MKRYLEQSVPLPSKINVKNGIITRSASNTREVTTADVRSRLGTRAGDRRSSSEMRMKLCQSRGSHVTVGENSRPSRGNTS